MRSYVSRRTLLAWLASAGCANSATPLIDIRQPRLRIIDDTNKSFSSLIPEPNGQALIDKSGYYFDIEPPLSGLSVARKQDFKQKRMFEKKISMELFNVHTLESLNLSIEPGFYNHGVHSARFDYFCRDWREDQKIKMDKDLLLQLISIVESLLADRDHVKINVLSAYRSAKTNAMLRKKSSQVAKNSFHMYGRALDLVMPDVNLSYLKRVAKQKSKGGLGIYKNFIHLDTGPRRNWIS